MIQDLFGETKEKVRYAVREFLAEGPRDNNVTSLRPRQLVDDDIIDFEDAARTREDRLWGEIDGLLDQLSSRHPMRVQAMKRDLKWLRKKALDRGYPWGKKR